MPRQAEEGYEYHVVGTRLRVTGVGDLELAFTDLDNIQTDNLVPIPMQTKTRFEPFRLSNIQSQRIRLVGQVHGIDEYFIISKIFIFVKPVAVEYPMLS